MNKPDDDIVRVRVFRESEKWNGHEKWWQMPAATLNELYLGEWDCDYNVTPRDSEYIRAQYSEPVVLVYI